uniref:Uncharacterized protein n=1 Tax=Nicotiana tabacum TaxID=4097 RepID=A0A1S4BG35_TOBAC|nr:PREDICTED: uncharacterized protein LOC107807894 [Nicotiana tabacum]
MGGRPPVPPARGRGRGRGRAAEVAPIDPPVKDQTQAEPTATPGLQETLAQILSVCTGLAQAMSASTAATSQTGDGQQTHVARTPEVAPIAPVAPAAPVASVPQVAPVQEGVVPVMTDD